MREKEATRIGRGGGERGEKETERNRERTCHVIF